MGAAAQICLLSNASYKHCLTIGHNHHGDRGGKTWGRYLEKAGTKETDGK